MTWRLALAGVCAAALAGCAGDEGGYNTELARELGESATELRAQLVAPVEPAAVPQFSPRQRRKAVAVLRGDLRQLTSSDVNELLDVEQQALRSSQDAAAALDKRAEALRATVVELDANGIEVSADVREFVASYNELAEAAGESAGDSHADMQVAVRSNQDLVGALEAIAAGMQTGEFQAALPKLRRAARSLAQLGRVQQRLAEQQPLNEILDQHAEALVEQANDSAQVSDLVDLLAKRYPDSVLADVLVRPDP